MKITLSKLSTKDLATLAQRTINVSESGTYAVITAHPLLADLKLKYANYDAFMLNKSTVGKEIRLLKRIKKEITHSLI